jgi:hypothetical protein
MGGRILRSGARVKLLAIGLAFVVACGTVPAHAGPSFFFRAKATLITLPQADQDNIEIALEAPSPFGLTTGVAVSIPLSATGNTESVTYRAAAAASMPGLSVDSVSGAVSATPSGTAGDTYVIAVEAVRDGSVVATTPALSRVLRAPLEVTAVPDDISLTAGSPFPTTGIGAQASGGDLDSVSWILEGAPAWLEIVPGAGARNAVLRVRDGMEVTETASTTVTVVASDAEGREDRSRSFNVVVLPGIAKLLANDGAEGDDFGHSVSLSADGQTALVGAYWDDDKGNNSGSAWVFDWSGSAWTPRPKLLAPDGAADDCFGYSVSLSADGRAALVGVYGDDDKGSYSGSAWVFDWSGSAWIARPKLLAPDGAVNDHFGISVSLSADGKTALVGAHSDVDNGKYSGSAWVFDWNGAAWTTRPKLLASDGAASDYFGGSVSLSADGSTALVGAYGDDDKGSSSGSAWVFGWSGSAWIARPKLLAPDGAAGGRFGDSVTLSSDGRTALVGAYGDDDKGAAWVFDWNGSTWTTRPKLLAPDGVAGDAFGHSVSLSADGHTAMVGADLDDDNGGNSGSAWVFDWNGSVWTPRPKLLAADGAVGDRFGGSVSLSGDGRTALVGSIYDDDNGSSSGSAYVFPLP